MCCYLFPLRFDRAPPLRFPAARIGAASCPFGHKDRHNFRNYKPVEIKMFSIYRGKMVIILHCAAKRREKIGWMGEKQNVFQGTIRNSRTFIFVLEARNGPVLVCLYYFYGVFVYQFKGNMYFCSTKQKNLKL